MFTSCCGEAPRGKIDSGTELRLKTDQPPVKTDFRSDVRCIDYFILRKLLKKLELVSDTPYGFQRPFVRYALKLFTKPLDMYVDRS